MYITSFESLFFPSSTTFRQLYSLEAPECVSVCMPVPYLYYCSRSVGHFIVIP